MTATSKGPNPFPAETKSRLQAFTELVATAIANADSRDQLAASRARVLAQAMTRADAWSGTCTTAPSSGSCTR
jgi:hypothetical protein